MRHLQQDLKNIRNDFSLLLEYIKKQIEMLHGRKNWAKRIPIHVWTYWLDNNNRKIEWLLHAQNKGNSTLSYRPRGSHSPPKPPPMSESIRNMYT